jgi:hypothetical protein
VKIRGLPLMALCLRYPRTAPAEATKEFRVCADPQNMPFSNRQLKDSRTRSPPRL